MNRLALLLLIALVPSSRTNAQGDSELRQRVAQIATAIGPRSFARGDTLVTFAPQGPILYHILGGSRDSVATTMIRNDGLVGTSATVWRSARLEKFVVRWFTPQAEQLSISGEVAGSALRLNGTRSPSVPLPSIPWGVADYGMEESLAPLLLSIPRGVETPVAVWRPFGQKWDTITVSVRASAGGGARVTKGNVTWGISDAGRLVWIDDARQKSTRRPLAGAPSFPTYERLKANPPE
jgi:hypothetical protein